MKASFANFETPVSRVPQPIELPSDVADHAKRIVDEGTALNTKRAYRGDLRYFWSWAKVAAGVEAPICSTPVALVVRFIIDHLGGMSAPLDEKLVADGIKAKPGPQRLSTIRRRLSALSVVHEAKGIDNPCRDSRVRKLLSESRESGSQERERTPKEAGGNAGRARRDARHL